MNADFEELYERFFHDVYLFILAASGDPYIAEEITQETFFRALKEIRHFKGNCSVKSWLCQIAKNLYISQKRKKPALSTEDIPITDISTEQSAEDLCIQNQQALSLYKILHYLDEPYKEVFTLRTLGDLSFKEIGEIFGKQENWARVTYYRARMKIQKKIQE